METHWEKLRREISELGHSMNNVCTKEFVAEDDRQLMVEMLRDLFKIVTEVKNDRKVS